MNTRPATRAGAAIDDVADRADETLERGRHIADETLEALHGTVDRTRSRVSELAQRGAERARALREDMRDRVDLASERTVGYVKDEPMKSMLMAAAAGAAIALLMRALAKRRY